VTALLQGLPPLVGPRTRLVVLGSFPGVASLQAQQYYGHPRNHFWPLVGALWQVDLRVMPYAERVAWLLDCGWGLWDVYAVCRRAGSLDSAIRDAEFNDLAGLRLRVPTLAAIAHNGRESARALRHTAALGLPVFKLPSSSPAHASWSFERKLAAWRVAAVGAGLSPPG
jgi:hypoxanthine-DNA glycosylase